MWFNNKFSFTKVAKVVPLLGALLLAACGGGGGGGDAAPAVQPAATTIAGLWKGSSSNGRSVVAITFQNGDIWALYSRINDPSTIAGGVQGTSTVTGNNFSSTDARDFSLEARTITTGRIDGSVDPKRTINGTATGAGTLTFSGTYDAGFEQPPSLATLAGTFVGPAAAASGSEVSTVQISSVGALSGSSTSGCRYTGTVSTRTDSSIYNVSVTFGGGVCAQGTATVTGIAYFDTTARRLYAVGLNAGRTDGLIYVGTKL